MLYHDYGRQDGQWLPNIHGGRENLEAVSLLRFINDSLHKQHAGFLCIAEESTAWPMVTKPPYAGGLGFDYKWDMGWMNDTLHYMQDDPVYHPYHHNALTFSMMYAFSENFVLPLSHDEVVHGKRTLLAKMPGGYRAQFAQLRLLLGYQFTHPGKKLYFMGTELSPFQEWRFYESLEWHLLSFDQHRGIQNYCRTLNHFYTSHPALYARDDSWDGYLWLNANDADRSVLSYLRMSDDEEIVVLCNFSPVRWKNYGSAASRGGRRARDLLQRGRRIRRRRARTERENAQARRTFHARRVLDRPSRFQHDRTCVRAQDGL